MPSTDRPRRSLARGVQQSHETVDMMPSPTEAAASPSPSPSSSAAAPTASPDSTPAAAPGDDPVPESVDPPHVVKLPWHLKLSPNLTPEETDAQLRAWLQVEKLRAESLIQPSMLLRYY